MGDDAWVAAALNVEQNPDLIRAGVGRQGGLSMLDAVSLADGATIGVNNDKPVRAGSVRQGDRGLAGGARWQRPDRAAPPDHRPQRGRGRARFGGHTGAALRAGVTADLGGLAAGSPPSFDGAGLENSYVIRALIDRRFRSDLAIERPLAVV